MCSWFLCPIWRRVTHDEIGNQRLRRWWWWFELANRECEDDGDSNWVFFFLLRANWVWNRGREKWEEAMGTYNGSFLRTLFLFILGSQKQRLWSREAVAWVNGYFWPVASLLSLIQKYLTFPWLGLYFALGPSFWAIFSFLDLNQVFVVNLYI